MKTIPLLFALLLTSCAARAAEPLAPPPGSKTAVFAGGCFWCMEADFEKKAGVLSAVSGYAGGPEKNPTYHQVGYGKTGHAEVVKVTYDPKKVTYAELVAYFFRHIDPTQKDGQFCDWGKQYRTVVFYADDAEKQIAQAAKDAAAKELNATIVTEVTKLDAFWPAEDYHQDYAKKDPGHYQSYRTGCGRDARVHQLWGR
jgi:peptide-methionine (S)-S-oxide reductase